MILYENDLNYRAVLGNILNGACPNIILISGDYGLGKTEFAKQIGRLLLCLNITVEGVCGKCEFCSKEITIDETFLSPITLLNMANKEKDEVKNLLKENLQGITFGKKIYIYDEFHSIQKEDQERWLSGSNLLGDSYLIMTTTKTNRIDKGILSRALKITMRPISLVSTHDLLNDHGFSSLDHDIISLLHRRTYGVPRDILVLAKFLHSSNLNKEEQILFIEGGSSIDLDTLFMLINEKIEYLKEAQKLINFNQDYLLVKAIEEYLYALIALGEEEYLKKSFISEKISYDKLFLLLEKAKNPVVFFPLILRIALPQTTIMEKSKHLSIMTEEKVKEQKQGGLSQW